MCDPDLKMLPAPPAGKTGWPWTAVSSPSPKRMQDSQSWPRISIVTPSYNQGQYIEETIRSVLLQGYPNLEYVVIDGGSTDDSVEIIRKYAPWLTYWVSESDRGQSHAINKGLVHCTGEIFNWINSDDLLCPGALKVVATAWRKAPCSIIAGPVVNFAPDGQEKITMPNGLTLRNFVDIKEAARVHWTWHQPGTYLPLAQVQSAGGVREDLRYTMDHFLMITLLQQCSVVCIEERLARFRLHGDSKTMSVGSFHFELERAQALRACRGLENYVTFQQRKARHIAALLSVGAIARREGFYGSAVKHILQALLISPYLVLQELLRRDFFNRLVRRLGRDIRSLRRSEDSPKASRNR
jgi:glycosyltransferase involved in cell wall biosynthesis